MLGSGEHGPIEFRDEQRDPSEAARDLDERRSGLASSHLEPESIADLKTVYGRWNMAFPRNVREEEGMECSSLVSEDLRRLLDLPVISLRRPYTYSIDPLGPWWILGSSRHRISFGAQASFKSKRS